MARIRTQSPTSGHTVLVVDDDSELRATIIQLLSGDGHEVIGAAKGSDAVQICQNRQVHLMLLDYFMPGMTGEEVIRQVRAFDQDLQIVLQTGYASEKPPRQMMRELDIQGFHDKSEGPDKMLVWVDAALKTFRQMRVIQASRSGLEYILKATPELHRLQPLDDLLKGVLLQIQGLVGFSSACVATFEHAMVSLMQEETLTIRVGTGRFDSGAWEDLSDHEQALVWTAVQTGESHLGAQVVLPLKAGQRSVGVVLVDNPVHLEGDRHLLEIFAAQAAVAIENVRLYTLATTDDLTGLMNKRPWLNRLSETVLLAARGGMATSVLVLDLDHFKGVNDHYGHLAGDQVLKAVGLALRQQLRVTDVGGRYGGEELMVILPQTDDAGCLVIAERLRAVIEALRIPWEGQELRVTVSIGCATVGPMGQADVASVRAQESDLELLARADTALYVAKAGGRNRVSQSGCPAASVAPCVEFR
ncbi:diguanylate cyclase (plasmid) [Deinococcus radiomollis]|uniref:GGDEF domain-containing response regulator n=1 Tax=Deinococcus radiomollis TaxID=468916 RepID=UPI0038915060